MQIEPSAQAFAERYARGEAQVVWTTLVADLETPVSAFIKIAGGKPMSFLLESVEGGDTRGRYSIIGLEPDLVWRAQAAKAEINRTARSKPDAFSPCPQPPLQALRALLAESRITLPEKLPPMAAGVFGYLGYDMVRLMEESAGPQSGPDRDSGRRAHPPDAGGHLRRGGRHAYGGDPGASGTRRRRQSGAGACAGTPVADRRRARAPARQGIRPRRYRSAGGDNRSPTRRPAITGRWC